MRFFRARRGRSASGRAAAYVWRFFRARRPVAPPSAFVFVSFVSFVVEQFGLRASAVAVRSGRSPAAFLTSELDTAAGAVLACLESELDRGPTIENRVKELRLARGWTQEELARAVGVSRQSINSIERHRYVPSLPLALLFARVFGVATDDLFRLGER